MKKKKNGYDKPRNPKGIGGFREHPESINREGRPKTGETFKDILAKKLEEHIIEQELQGKDVKEIDRGTKREILVEAWIHHAINGSWQHLQGIVNRIDGAILPDIDDVDENALKAFIFQQINLRSDFKYDKEGNLLNDNGKDEDGGNGRLLSRKEPDRSNQEPD